MYEHYFKFKIKPFELVPNPDFLFLSSGHKKALSYLKYGISENSGFILLTGEVGSGKTTIIRDLIKNLNGSVTLSKVFNTKVTSDQLIALINEDFGLSVDGKDRVAMLRELNDFLIEQHADRKQPILIIDEAQNLDSDLLEEIRLLSNLETNMSKLLQIVLVGQPELRRILAGPHLRQLRQRISISCHIKPLTRAETEKYIHHRLERAGGRDAVRFQDGTLDVIHSYSRGIPRLINIVCDFLMLAAFTEKTREITLAMTEEIVKELEVENRYWDDEVQVPEAAPEGFEEIVGRLRSVEEQVRLHAETTAALSEARDSLEDVDRDVKPELQRLSARLWEMELRMRNIFVDLVEIKKKLERMTPPAKPRKFFPRLSRD